MANKINFSIPCEGDTSTDVKVRATKDLISALFCAPVNHRAKGIKRMSGDYPRVVPTVHGNDLEALGNGYYSIRGNTDAVVDDLAILEGYGHGHPDHQ